MSSSSNKARFVTGSTMGHILRMTTAMGAGLMAIFLVDLADIYFLGLLQKPEITAAMGFAGPVLFFTLSICIGSAIAMGALVAKQVGAGDEQEGRRFATHILFYGVLVTGILSFIVWLFIANLLHLLGARGEAHAHAMAYLKIILPSMPLLSVAMSSGTILRAIGDGKRSALAMLSGSIVNAGLDPVFIFTLDMGIEGAALASVCARLTMVSVALHWIYHRHGFLARPAWKHFKRQLPLYMAIAIPVILTNIATPLGHAYVTASLAPFGDEVMSGSAVMWRVVPVAFFALFALSGAIGPIIGQNFGARKFDRVERIFTDSLLFVSLYVAFAGMLVFFFQNRIISAFHISGEGAVLAAFYFTWLAWFFVFDGAIFAANAIFNNLGHPRLSTAFNWGKATLGTIPFVALGSALYGAKGVFTGLALGSVIFGLLSIYTCIRIIKNKAHEQA